MTQQHLNIIDTNQERQITDLHLETLLQTLDKLHDAAYQDQLAERINISRAELIGWLEDIIFTAQETINEIAAQEASDANQERSLGIAGLSIINLYHR